MSKAIFKFELGDIVRHATHKHNSVFAQEETLAGIVIVRSWHEEFDGLFYPTYTIDTIAGKESGISELTLELVERPKQPENET